MAQATWVTNGSTQIANAASVVTPTFGAALAGDLGVIIIVDDNVTGNLWTIPAGWTSVYRGQGLQDMLITVYYKVLTGSETTITMSRTGAVNGYCGIFYARNVDTTSPLINSVLTTSSNSTSHTTGSIGTVPANTLNVGIWGIKGTASTNSGTAGTNYTERMDVKRSTAPFMWLYVESNETLTGSGVNAAFTSSVAVTGSEVMLYIAGISDSPPTFTVGPTVAYGSLTRLSSTNNATITTTVTDDVTTGANALTYALRTSATVGGGSLVTSGTMTSGTSKVITLNSTMTGLTTSGAKTVYLQVTDGGGNTTVSSALTVNVDLDNPNTFSATGSNAVDNLRYKVTTAAAPTDTTSTASNELSWQIRTAASGGGTLITSGTVTSGVAFDTGYFYDDLLSSGSNNRWLRITDGGGNVTEDAFTVSVSLSSANLVVSPSSAADDGFYADGNANLSTSSTGLYFGGEFASPYLDIHGWFLVPLTIPQGATINAAFVRGVAPDDQLVDTANGIINAAAVDNATAPTTYAGASGQARTTAQVSWNSIPHFFVGATYDSPDIASVIQEIVNRPGWASGNKILIYMNETGTSAANSYRRIRSMDVVNTAVRGTDSNGQPTLYVTYATSQTYNETTGGQVASTLVTTSTVGSVVLTETAAPDAHTTVQSGTDVIVLNEATGVTTHTMVTTGTDHVVLTETSNPDAHTLNTPAGAETANINDFTSPDAHTMVVLGPVNQLTGLESASPVIIASVTIGSDLTAQNELSGLTAHTLVTVGAEAVIRNDLNVPQTFVFVTTGSVDRQMSTDTTSTVIIVSNATYDIEVQGVLVDETTTPMQIVSNLLGSDVATFNADVTQTQIIVSQTIGPVDRVISTDTGSMVISSATLSTIEFLIYVDLGSMVITSQTLSTLEQFGVSDIANTVQIISVTPFLAETVVRNDFNAMVMVFNTPAGFETSSFTDFTNTVVMVMTFAGVDTYSIGLFEHYQPQALVVLEPYTDSTLMVIDPYQGMITILDPYEGTLTVKR